ncbi:MAG: hypothetical protein AB7E85_06700 [Pseudobdellovibrionaceae bacterium]
MTATATPLFTQFAGSPEGQSNFMDIMRTLPMINSDSGTGPLLVCQDKGHTLTLFLAEDDTASFDLDGMGRPLDAKVRGYVSAHVLNGGNMVHMDRRPYITRLDENCEKGERAYPLWGATESINRVPVYLENSSEAARDHDGLQFIWTFLKKFAPDHPYVAARLEEQGEPTDLSIVQAVQRVPAR